MGAYRAFPAVVECLLKSGRVSVAPTSSTVAVSDHLRGVRRTTPTIILRTSSGSWGHDSTISRSAGVFEIAKSKLADKRFWSSLDVLDESEVTVELLRFSRPAQSTTLPLL